MCSTEASVRFLHKAPPCAYYSSSCRAPFATHQLSIEQRGSGDYWALACLKEKRQLAAPSGLGSFDACIFDLADGDSAASITMMLQGKGDYISTPCEPLPSGPEWSK